MSFSLITAYPFWLILLCMSAGFAYSAALYYRNPQTGFSRPTQLLLAGLRMISITSIAFLLLSPLFKTTFRQKEKPIIVLALDNSESILVGRDSAYYKNEFPADFKKLAEDLTKKYEVRTYHFSDKIESGLDVTFKGKQTDISRLFTEINTRYSNRNLAAVVLAGDGIVTRGSDPLFVAEKVPYSIYSIAMGDTSQHRDLLVARVNYNRIAYLGNSFPLEITILGHQCSGSRSRLTVNSGDKQLYSEELNIGAEDYSKIITVMLSASVAGVQRFRVSVSPVDKEISVTNNYQDIFVEVLDGRQKVLILSDGPHPDISALREAIEINRNFEVENMFLNEFSGNVNKYSLVILHQIPSVTDAGSQLLNQLKANKIPVLYILGSQTNLQAFNALQEGLSIPPSTSALSAAYAAKNPNFSQFSVSPEISKLLSEFPPLNVPFGQYKTSTSTETLLFQRIGSVTTSMPLIMFNQGLDRKSGVISGEGIWRWRLTNYLKLGNHVAFDNLVSKMVQYLSIKADKSQFRVIAKNNFTEDEAVEMDAELYNDSYELQNEPDINIIISNKAGKNFPYTFSRTANAYYLNAGGFPPGDYTYKASTSLGNKSFQKSGSFVVMALNEEMMNTVANHNLLFSLAKQHNGEMVSPRDLHKIAELLGSRDDIRTISYVQKKYTDLVNIFWVFLALLALLSVEWFIRKRNGGY